MARFAERFGQRQVKEKRLEELRGLLHGWQMRAEGATDLGLSEKEQQVLKEAMANISTALTALGSLNV